MGVESSRMLKMNSEVEDKNFREKKIQEWIKFNYLEMSHNKMQTNTSFSTMVELTLCNAGKKFNNFLNREGYDKLNFLEVGSGNRKATHFFTKEFLNHISALKTTDIVPYETDHPEIDFDNIHSVDAVFKYGDWTNVLLLISPLPASHKDLYAYSDYYACYDFINNENNKDKFIVFVGELGASDGTIGMYDYLINNNKLDLCERQMVRFSKDVIGGNVEKEIFIFRIKKVYETGYIPNSIEESNPV